MGENENQTQGKWDQAKGNVKEHVGDAIGNEQMEYEGKLEQGKGEVREGVGNLQENVDEATDRR